MISNTKSSWGALARLLHWGMAGIIIYQLVMGIWMSNFVQDTLVQFSYVQTHKSWDLLFLP